MKLSGLKQAASGYCDQNTVIHGLRIAPTFTLSVQKGFDSKFIWSYFLGAQLSKGQTLNASIRLWGIVSCHEGVALV